MSNPLVGLADVEALLDTALSDTQQARVCLALDAMYATLEGDFNRVFVPRTITDEYHRVANEWEGPIEPFYGPVNEIYYFRSDEITSASSNDGVNDWSSVYFYAGQQVWITYNAGGPVDAEWMPALRAVVLNAVVRSIIQGPQVAYGVIGSYSVEGTTVTYTDVNAQGNLGPMTVADLSSISFLRRPRYR